MAILRRPSGKFREFAVVTTTDFDEVNDRAEFCIEMLERGKINSTLYLDLEEAGCLHEDLQEFLAINSAWS